MNGFQLDTSGVVWPEAACCSPDLARDGCCACPAMERAIRAWRRSDPAIPAMAADQREALLCEIARVEGFDRGDYEGGDDATVAGGVLDAWTDFCRDKGLL